MMFACNKRRNSNPSGDASKSYAALEARQLLAFAPLPEMTTDVAEFAQTVDDAVVRVDDQQRLIIRTTGANNSINISLEQSYLYVNRSSFDALALEIDQSQYDQIILISGGDDSVSFSGVNLTAQLHPDRVWVSSGLGPFGENDKTPIQINGTNFERLEVNDSSFGDFGPTIHSSQNRIRMFGSDGVDRLTMQSNNAFAIATSASLVGDGYHYSTNAFGDLFVSGGGGEDFASLAGTRGYADDAFLVSGSSSGDDVYIGRDNFSRISNELWDGRFVDFETQRVDLLSGEDRSFVDDTDPENTYYRVDGQDLVGAFRRFIGSEFIEINGADTPADTLFRPDTAVTDAVFSEAAGEFNFASTNPIPDGDDTEEDDNGLPNISQESIPDYFAWTFTSFERLVG